VRRVGRRRVGRRDSGGAGKEVGSVGEENVHGERRGKQGMVKGGGRWVRQGGLGGEGGEAGGQGEVVLEIRKAKR